MGIFNSIVRKNCFICFDNILNQVKGILQICVFIEWNGCLVDIELLGVSTVSWIHLWVHSIEVNVEGVEGTATISSAVEEHIDAWVGSI